MARCKVRFVPGRWQPGGNLPAKKREIAKKQSAARERKERKRSFKQRHIVIISHPFFRFPVRSMRSLAAIDSIRYFRFFAGRSIWHASCQSK